MIEFLKRFFYQSTDFLAKLYHVNFNVQCNSVISYYKEITSLTSHALVVDYRFMVHMYYWVVW